MNKGNGFAKHCIIDLQGRIHLCEVGKSVNPHQDLAELLNPNAPKWEAAYQLVERGYIFAGSDFVAPYSGKQPNQAQINTLYDLQIKYVSCYFDKTSWQVY